MDILIKGMEMPKDCEECRFHSKQDVIVKGCVVHFCRAQRVGRTYNLHYGCPLVALPSHGDLIDRKALSDAIDKVITDRDRMIGTYDTIEQFIDEAETIVEATE